MSHWISRIRCLKTSLYLHKFPIFPVSFSTSAPQISFFNYLVNHHHFSPECASKASSSSSSSSSSPTNYLSKTQNAYSILHFLKETGFSKNQIEAVVRKVPWVLSADVHRTIKPKIKVFQDLGFHSSDFASIISTSPWLLNSSADRLRLSILGLKNVLGPNVDICSFLKKAANGRCLMFDWGRTFSLNLEYLRSCGICSSQIASYVCHYPAVFLAKPETLEGIVKRAVAMGAVRESKMFLEAVRVIGGLSRETFELKMKLFRDLGFSEQNVLHVFKVYPAAFSVSERKIKEVIQLLLSVEEFNFSISDIACNPVLLAYSVEKRLKPRLQVLKALHSKNLLTRIPGLASFCQITDANFKNKYVIPYLNELGDSCVFSQGS